jgi:hypothetical protein
MTTVAALCTYLASRLAGRRPRFRGASATGIYLKWVLKGDDPDSFRVLADRVSEEFGVNVAVAHSANRYKGEDQEFVKLTIDG